MGEEVHVDYPAACEGGIPLIDLFPLTTTDHTSRNPIAKLSLISQVRYACENFGIFQVINHGVPLETREKLEFVAKTFFGLSSEEKGKVRRDEKNPYGYHDSMHTSDAKDSKEVFDFAAENKIFLPASHEPDDDELIMYVSQWPQHPPEFREVCEEYVKQVKILAYKLLGLIALSLGVPEDSLHEFVRDGTSYARLSYYPHCPDPAAPGFGIGPHKDPGLIVILAQDDVGGLEVKRKSDGEWMSINPIPNAFVVNVADILQVLSNDIYVSAEHRVLLNQEKDRFSIPFSFNPSHDTIVQPLKELTDEQNPPKYEPFNWGKFRVARNRSNFMKLNAVNLGIRHFKISE